VSTQEIANQYKEALRYMDNAKEILRTKAAKKDGAYQDAKYVRMACGTAYNAVLIALNAYLKMKGKKIHGKPNNVNADDYRRALKDDKKMLNHYNDTWTDLHCAGYYNGNLSFKVIARGMKAADAIINAIRPAN